MKDPDEAINRVLAGLRETEAPEGMERRILDAIQLGAAKKREQGFMRLLLRPSLSYMRSPAIAAAVAVVVASLICLIVFWNHRIGHDIATEKTHGIQATVPVTPIQAAAVRRFKPMPQRPTGKSQYKSNARRPIHQGEPAVQSEMAENHPAPEAPLTEEERLLLRFAHRADPQRLEAFNPALRSARSLWAAQEREEKAEFQRFFEPSTTTNNE